MLCYKKWRANTSTEKDEFIMCIRTTYRYANIQTEKVEQSMQTFQLRNLSRGVQTFQLRKLSRYYTQTLQLRKPSGTVRTFKLRKLLWVEVWIRSQGIRVDSSFLISWPIIERNSEEYVSQQEPGRKWRPPCTGRAYFDLLISFTSREDISFLIWRPPVSRRYGSRSCDWRIFCRWHCRLHLTHIEADFVATKRYIKFTLIHIKVTGNKYK